MWSVVFVVFFFVCNVFLVKLFVEIEFWFFSVKIVIIILFIILGGVVMFGLIFLNGMVDVFMLLNFIDYGGLFLNGFFVVFIVMIFVSFVFFGIELIGVIVGELVNF